LKTPRDACWAPLTIVRFATLAIALGIVVQPVHAVTVKIDYSYDSSNFFGGGNPNGAAAGTKAKAALEAAATYFSDILADSFSAIETPPTFESAQFSGEYYWTWSLNFTNPASGTLTTLPDVTIPADEYRIYAGARQLGGTTLGRGGPGGYSWEADSNDGGFSSQEIDQINAITAEFSDAVEQRGEANGFARWGGAVAFDSVGTAWNYDHTATNFGTLNDFYSVAIHEMAHALGFGASSEWTALAGGATFSGLAAKAANGNMAPPLEPPNPARSHWQSGLMSQVLGTNTVQETAMDPEITQGMRKYFTKLDAAAMTDIGWDVVPPSQTFNPADFNQDTFVNATDLTRWKLAAGVNAMADADGDNDSDGNDFLIWQREIGNPAAATVPEPSAATLFPAAAAALLGAHRRQRRRRVQAASSGRI
jgi:hypothetical protein